MAVGNRKAALLLKPRTRFPPPEVYLGHYLGLDIGTTTVTAIVVNSEAGDVLSRATEPNDSEITSVQDKKQGRIVVESGSQAGQLSPQWVDTGLDSRVPVCVASGDNQASFLGSVREPDETVLVNVGTGGQVSVSASTPDVGPGLEARPHVDGRYILVGAGRVSGRTYAWLRDFYLEVGRQIFNIDGDPESVYKRMTDLAGNTDPGAGGLTFDPLLTGTREDPERRGVIEGIGTVNFDPGHLSRALLEGVIAQFRLLYGNAVAVGVSERSVLIGAGNGVRRNPVLREIAEQKSG